MKMVSILLLTAIPIASTAKAASLNYQVSAPYVIGEPSASGDDKLCPQILDATVETKGQTDEAVSLTLNQSGPDYPAPAYAATGSWRTCYSDVVCPNSDSFDAGKNTAISMERNNNGEYPTTDLPGYSQLVIYTKAGSGKEITCVYSLKAR